MEHLFGVYTCIFDYKKLIYIFIYYIIDKNIMTSEILNAIELLSNHFNITENILKDFLNKNNNIHNEDKKSESNFIIPYFGVINEECCKGIIYNHGLYTQCTNKTSSDICKSCKSLKYGRIEERLNCKPGELFVLKNGKKEIEYKKIIKKFKYDISELKLYFTRNNINYNLHDEEIKSNPIKKGRGRPRKILIDDNSPLYNVKRLDTDNEELVKEETNSDDEDEIVVEEITINGKDYYLTAENVLLDKSNHSIVGIYKNGTIEKIK
tara:strand:+ start:3280 stop:4077 length:798 start_codon:yes stop_codon:yes gene_type:complete